MAMQITFAKKCEGGSKWTLKFQSDNVTTDDLLIGLCWNDNEASSVCRIKKSEFEKMWSMLK